MFCLRVVRFVEKGEFNFTKRSICYLCSHYWFRNKFKLLYTRVKFKSLINSDFSNYIVTLDMVNYQLPFANLAMYTHDMTFYNKFIPEAFATNDAFRKFYSNRRMHILDIKLQVFMIFPHASNFHTKVHDY